MGDPIARFGTFVGIDANGQGKANDAAFWASITSAPLDSREIPQLSFAAAPWADLRPRPRSPDQTELRSPPDLRDRTTSSTSRIYQKSPWFWNARRLRTIPT
jgi:hypothetical protein